MKNFLLFAIVLILMSCGENEMQKDARELAELTLKAVQIQKKIESGDKSLLPESEKLGTELKTLIDEFQKKYPLDGGGLKFGALYKKIYNEISNKPEEVVDEAEPPNPLEDKLIAQTKEILMSNAFYTATNQESIIVFNFNDTLFTFRVLTNNGIELSRAIGTYEISPAIDGSIANIKIYLEGPIQKSPLYSDKTGIGTELFLRFNKELLLKYPSEKLVSYLGTLNILTMGNNKPNYFLVGRDVFYSLKKNTQAEKDSIVKAEIINEKKKAELEEKKAELEEKLKGL